MLEIQPVVLVLICAYCLWDFISMLKSRTPWRKLKQAMLNEDIDATAKLFLESRGLLSYRQVHIVITWLSKEILTYDLIDTEQENALVQGLLDNIEASRENVEKFKSAMADLRMLFTSEE